LADSREDALRFLCFALQRPDSVTSGLHKIQHGFDAVLIDSFQKSLERRVRS
jgi:hypothetical protein